MDIGYKGNFRFGNYYEEIKDCSPNFGLYDYLFQKIQPRDKVLRGVGLTPQEECYYRDICDMGTDAMLLCYSKHCGRTDAFSSLEIKAMCSTCNHFCGEFIE